MRPNAAGPLDAPRRADHLLRPGPLGRGVPGDRGSIATAGHLVGNHSHYHARMPLLTDAGLVEDIAEAGRVILETTGVDPRPWFRCPFGAGVDDPRVQAAVHAAGYRHVGWHVGVEDWDRPSAADASRRRGRAAPSPTATARRPAAHLADARRARRSRGSSGRLREAGRDVRPDRRARRDPERRGREPSAAAARSRSWPSMAATRRPTSPLVGRDGPLLASGRGPTSSHQAVGLEPGPTASSSRRTPRARRAGPAASGPGRRSASYALAGADSPADVRRLLGAFDARGLTATTLVVNDAFAPSAPARSRLGGRRHLRRGVNAAGWPGRADGPVRRARARSPATGAAAGIGRRAWARRSGRATAAARGPCSNGPLPALRRASADRRHPGDRVRALPETEPLRPFAGRLRRRERWRRGRAGDPRPSRRRARDHGHAIIRRLHLLAATRS